MNKIQIDKLVENHGQISGLPSNPRTISDDKLQKLKQSLIDDPEMLESRPLLVYPYKGENSKREDRHAKKCSSQIEREQNKNAAVAQR